jgi:hypothetical protein
MLEAAKSDVLFLLDCCAAASSISRARMNKSTGIKGTIETITASGFETWAPRPGFHSFTNTLIQVLEDWAQSHVTFTIAHLHTEVLSRLKQMPLESKNAKGRLLEWRKTLVYSIKTENPRAPSITLLAKRLENKHGQLHSETETPDVMGRYAIMNQSIQPVHMFW